LDEDAGSHRAAFDADVPGRHRDHTQVFCDHSFCNYAYQLLGLHGREAAR
jgi:hypothetical protein